MGTLSSGQIARRACRMRGAECGKPLTVICLMKLLLGSMVVVVVAAVVAASASIVVSQALVVAAVAAESPVAAVVMPAAAPAAYAALVEARSPAPVDVPEVEDVASTSVSS